MFARWRLQGQLRDWPLSGQPQHPSDSRLSINKSSVAPGSLGLSGSSTHYYILSFTTLLSVDLTGKRRGLITARRSDRSAVLE